MRVIIMGVLVLALAVAGVSTYLIKTFGTKEAVEKLEKDLMDPERFVLVAKKPLDVGTVIKPEHLSWQVWEKKAIQKDYVVFLDDGQSDRRKQREEYHGTLVRHALAEGEPILPAKIFKRDKPGFLAGMLAPGMRAATIKVSETSAAAGFIFPGDRVDVILTHNLASRLMDPNAVRDPSNPLDVMTSTSETILWNRRVLSIGQKVEGFKQKASLAPTVTIEVTPKEREKLAVAKTMGRMSLSLRSMADNASTPSEEEAATSFTTDVETSPYLTAKREARKAENEQVDEETGEVIATKPTIRIYRGASRATQEIE